MTKMLKLTERQAKQATVMRHMTTFQVLSSRLEEEEAMKESFLLNQNSQCRHCHKQIGQFPFFYLPETKQVCHAFCAEKEGSVEPEASLEARPDFGPAAEN